MRPSCRLAASGPSRSCASAFIGATSEALPIVVSTLPQHGSTTAAVSTLAVAVSFTSPAQLQAYPRKLTVALTMILRAGRRFPVRHNVGRGRSSGRPKRE
eukprot:293391-Prymnesium_polylepis.2